MKCKQILVGEKVVDNAAHFEIKIKQFQKAMERYHNHTIYNKLGFFISVVIVLLQGTALIDLVHIWKDMDCLQLSLALINAYIMTDFINGFVHLYMDNNTNYNSIFGPFIAAFHLHHIKPRYTNKNPFKVYFYESGTKFWLVFYMAGVSALEHYFNLPVMLQCFLIFIGFLSSFAEVSHYWCHNSSSKNVIVRFLQQQGILLSKKHHIIHHVEDNKNYAFLNGMTNPLLNKIAAYLYDGYKSHSEQHAKAYSGLQTDNRKGR